LAGSREQHTGGLAFSRPRSVALTFGRLAAWSVVEDDLHLLANIRIEHEWYPQKDYETHVSTGDAGRVGPCIMQFDFGLLQAVLPLDRA
jgi:hypothetical protein